MGYEVILQFELWAEITRRSSGVAMGAPAADEIEAVVVQQDLLWCVLVSTPGGKTQVYRCSSHADAERFAAVFKKKLSGAPIRSIRPRPKDRDDSYIMLYRGRSSVGSRWFS